MRKFALLFVALLMSTPFFAQEHLDFRGVPIDGKLADFVVKMEKLGYTVDKKIDNVVIMNGKFTNKPAEIYILATPQTKTVWKVAVHFDDAVSWSSLKSMYREYKELYTKKYGSPSNSFEFFKDPYYEGDGYELQALRKEKCTYVTYYEVEAGFLAIRMTSSGAVSLAYEDKENSDLDTNEKNSSALDEI